MLSCTFKTRQEEPLSGVLKPSWFAWGLQPDQWCVDQYHSTQQLKHPNWSATGNLQHTPFSNFFYLHIYPSLYKSCSLQINGVPLKRKHKNDSESCLFTQQLKHPNWSATGNLQHTPFSNFLSTHTSQPLQVLLATNQRCSFEEET
jgi:hypothetical protein